MSEKMPDYGSEGSIDPRFVREVLDGLQDTNFARGWGGSEMYADFLDWCERAEEADEIISTHSSEISVLLLDKEEGARVVSMRANAATELMKALLKAFEQKKLRALLGR